MPADSAMGGSARPLTDSPPGLRWGNAGNAGPFTLEGTRSYIVGRRRVAIVDPGTPLAAHVEALAAAVRGADSVTLLMTHGHPDHSGACPELAARLETEVAGAWGSEVGEEEGGGAGPPPDVTFRCLADMESVATDCGELIALETPGHARKHVVFHWPMRQRPLRRGPGVGSGQYHVGRRLSGMRRRLPGLAGPRSGSPARDSPSCPWADGAGAGSPSRALSRSPP